MDTAIIGISSFLVSGAAIIVGTHIAFVVSTLRASAETSPEHAQTRIVAKPVASPPPTPKMTPATAEPTFNTPNFEAHRQAFQKLTPQPYRL